MFFDRFTRQIWDDLQARFACQRKTQRDKLAVLVSRMLQLRARRAKVDTGFVHRRRALSTA